MEGRLEVSRNRSQRFGVGEHKMSDFIKGKQKGDPWTPGIIHLLIMVVNM